MHSLIKIILISVGSLSVLLGILGIFLPLLPTTPFLLLAALCYSRSSERFYQWLVTNRWFGEYIRNYREGRGITSKHKISILCLLLHISEHSDHPFRDYTIADFAIIRSPIPRFSGHF